MVIILLTRFCIHRDSYGTEMVERVILTQLEGMEQDEDVEVRKEIVKLLVVMAIPLQTPIVLNILQLLEKVRFNKTCQY